MDIVSSNIDDLYRDAIKSVLNHGINVTARGLDFTETRFQHLILTNPRARMIQNPVRKFSKRFAMAEFIWMMSGKASLDQIEFYNKRMREFSDDGIQLHGAYGPRLRHWDNCRGDVDQLENCLQRLKNDLYTRQASIVILDPSIDFTVKTKDVPCNNYLQFLYREGKLDLMCYVRSNDLNLGLPYDIFHWTLLQEIFASVLDVEVGDYHHIVGSLHIYKKDWELLDKVSQYDNPHMPMDKMPKNNDLSIFDKLATFEQLYREQGIFDSGILPIYWQNYVAYLGYK